MQVEISGKFKCEKIYEYYFKTDFYSRSISTFIQILILFEFNINNYIVINSQFVKLSMRQNINYYINIIHFY